MSRVLFNGSLFLLLIWAIGFFGLNKGGIIHILPVIAVIALMARLFYNKSVKGKTQEEDTI